MRPARRQALSTDDAVDLRQAEVEDHGVVGLGLAEELAFLAVESRVDRVARMLQRGDDLAVEVLVVLDDEQAHGRSAPYWTAPTLPEGPSIIDMHDSAVLAQDADHIQVNVAVAAQHGAQHVRPGTARRAAPTARAGATTRLLDTASCISRCEKHGRDVIRSSARLSPTDTSNATPIRNERIFDGDGIAVNGA